VFGTEASMNSPLRRPGCVWKVHIKVDLGGTGYDVEWIKLAWGDSMAGCVNVMINKFLKIQVIS
jgi:hypothetical protein